MANVLEIKNLSYKNILKDITFSLEKNSFTILVGNNAVGKTTIVNCIRGVLDYKGTIELFNKNIKRQTGIYNNVGFFIEDNVILEKDLFSDLMVMLINLGYEEEKAKKRIYSVIKKLDFLNLLYKKNYDLELYEKTLINFIFSIIHNPKLLIIDKDLEILDEKYKKIILDYIKSKKELTVLFITNNSENFYLADDILLLKNNKSCELIKPDEIIINEKQIIKCGSQLPFNMDLSNKLISYELLDEIELDIEKLVNKIWQ